MGYPAPLSFLVQTTLSAKRIVTHLTGTANMVKYPASVAEKPIGITTDTVLDTTGSIPVAVMGVEWLQFNDTCPSGNLVASDSAGLGVAYVNNTAGGYVIGTLVGPTIALTGTIAKVLIQPHWKIIT